MSTKLTLTIDKSLIEKAKGYAKSQGRSLSELVAMYFAVIVNKEGEDSISSEPTPVTDSLLGMFKEPEGFDYKKAITERLEKKYLEDDDKSID